MPFIALLILCSAAISCDKKVVRSVDVPTEDVAVEDVPTEDVLANAALVCSGSLQLPTGAGLLAEDLQVLSFYGEGTPNAAGKFNISMTNNKKPQFVFAIDPETDNSVLLGYVDPAQGEHVNLSCESTAVSLAFLNPLMIGTTAAQRSEFISGIKAHPKFSLLVDAVEATFQADPQNVLNYTAHPELYEQAVEISVDVWREMTAAGKLLAPMAAQDNVCKEDKQANVWIKDEEGNGNKIVFCNPKMVIYVASIMGGENFINTNEDFNGFEFTYSEWRGLGNNFIDEVHVAPKGSAITPTFGFDWGTSPEPTEYTLPIDGDLIEYHITRGYSFGADGKWTTNWGSLFNWNQPYGRASLLNIALGAYYLLDIFSPIPLAPGTSIPNIANQLGRRDLSFADRMGEMRSIEPLGEGTSTFNAIKSFVTTMLDIGTEVLKILLKEALPLTPDEANLQRSAKKAKGIIKNVTGVLKLYDLGNVTVPFFVDLFSAWPEFRGQFSHRGGEMGPAKWREGVTTETFSIPGGESMKFVWINPGIFSMGARLNDSEKQENESPQRPVEISEGFWLGTHEVTQGQWEAVMGGTEWAERWSGDLQVRQHPLHPAVMISWDEVQEFIARLNETAGDWKYRLPTEAEWEYACRAGTTTQWSFGDDESLLKDYAWYQGNIEGNYYARPVWMKEANPWGLHDMHGNVREWVHDWLGIYSYTPGPASASFIDPQGPSTGSQRVIRGGSFAQPAQNLRSPYRRGKYPEDRDPETGFRLVRIKEPEPPEPLWEEETFELLENAEMTMVRVEPGTFWMGEPDQDSNEQPVHEVEISEAFWLSKHEVTQGQWYEVMKTMPWDGQDWAFKDSVERYPSYPATYISWEDVQEFIARLNDEAGGRYYRLPTEAEWEYACRADTETPWSSEAGLIDLEDYAWYNTDYGRYDTSTEYPQLVNLKRANPWGLHDMHGNVAEWVQDWYDPEYYNISPEMDPQGPLWPVSSLYHKRVVRGGSINDQTYTRSASRRYYSPATRDADIGFRLVRLLEPEREASAEAPREHTFSLGGADMKMVRIKRGVFEMGTSDYPNASPHEVEISKNFWLGTHEVTQGQWEAVMGGTEWTAPWAEFGVQSEPAYPATYVSWEAAQEFIARLNEMEGRYYRLPTEAEWEYACRAETQTRWSFGDDESHLRYYAWYEDIASYALSVGLKRANPWGLRDMHGNVAEWVQDWFDAEYYANSPRLNPQGPLWPPIDTVPHRVIRGGGFNTLPVFTQSAFRWIAPPGSGSPFIGFRLVRDVTQQEVPTQRVRLPGGASMEFVGVEPGVFLMGSDNGDSNERPVHEVEISKKFWLGQYEVTKAQWEAVMEPPSKYSSRWAALSESDPAIGISWNMAQDFIARLNEQAGERRYRLPSEAEWEYACRAGMPTRWSFGEDERRLEHYAWYRDNASGVNEVGQKRPNFWGLHDMHGNVWEWVQDRYDEDYYAESPVMDPAGPDTGNARVRRGGIYNNRAEGVRSARREGSNPASDDVSFGFRLVMLDEPEPLSVNGDGAAGAEVLALTGTLLVSILDLFPIALLAFGLDEAVPVDGIGGGTVVLAGSNWTMQDYSPDGSLIINGSLVVDMMQFPAVPISGELTTSGSIESTVVFDLLFDLESAALIGMITIDGADFDMADIIAAAEEAAW